MRRLSRNSLYYANLVKVWGIFHGWCVELVEKLLNSIEFHYFQLLGFIYKSSLEVKIHLHLSIQPGPSAVGGGVGFWFFKSLKMYQSILIPRNDLFWRDILLQNRFNYIQSESLKSRMVVLYLIIKHSAVRHSRKLYNGIRTPTYLFLLQQRIVKF